MNTVKLTTNVYRDKPGFVDLIFNKFEDLPCDKDDMEEFLKNYIKHLVDQNVKVKKFRIFVGKICFSKMDINVEEDGFTVRNCRPGWINERD